MLAGDKLSVHLFTNYAGERQFSMLRYAEELRTALVAGHSDACTVKTFAPPSSNRTSKLHSYWQRYVTYPSLARANAGPINHITDHSNAHLLGALPPERTVVTCHDLMMLRARRGLEGGSQMPAWRFLWTDRMLRLLTRAAHLIADSEQTQRDLAEFLGVASSAITTVYPGVNHQFFRPLANPDAQNALRHTLGVTWRWTLLQVGSHFFYKNTPGVLQTLARLRHRLGADVHLVTVGSAWTSAQEALIRSLGLQEAVHAQGRVAEERLRQWYHASDVLFYPSWWEGFGWPPLEAMACGLPVVASERGSLAEVLGGAAAVVEPSNIDQMADRVEQVLSDAAQRSRLIEKGLARAAQFTWSQTARQVLQVYRRVTTIQG